MIQRSGAGNVHGQRATGRRVSQVLTTDPQPLNSTVRRHMPRSFGLVDFKVQEAEHFLMELQREAKGFNFGNIQSVHRLSSQLHEVSPSPCRHR
jgi:hypothetical protein